jgi:CheY-like chemotaxis protein
LAAERGIAVRAEPFPDARHVLADRQRLVQVLLNLLSNGVKYNRAGGTVVVAGEMADRGHWRIRVTDTGPGIAPDKLGRLFTPFDRLGAEVSGVEGTGLGLALSKHLIEVMGGTLQVSSQVGAGSTFAVELPMAEAPIEAALPRPWAPVPDRAEPGPAQAVILYVEDNLANLRLVERIVARRPGVTLLSAMQGQMGVDLAREHHPDLILLDQHLPDMAGDAVIGLLRADPRTRGIPIVMLSADASPRQIQRLRELGARDYLTKPLDVTRLLALLDDTIARVKAASAPK